MRDETSRATKKTNPTKTTKTKPKKTMRKKREEEPTPQQLNAMVLRPVLEELERAAAQTSVDLDRGERWKLTKGGILVVRDHYSVIPERDPEQNPAWKSKERRKYTSQAAWDREQEVVDEAGGGERVFADVLLTSWKKIVIEDPQEIADIVEQSREWEVGGGFDHGKTNPTCLLRTYVDFEGTIIIAGEYYMPGLEIWQHAPMIKRMYDLDRMQAGSLGIQADRSIFPMTQQQEQRPGHAPERAKSYADLYYEQGVTNLQPFPGDASDVSFALRLHSHWSDLEHRAPSVRIICPRGLYADKPQPGLYHWGCPNLLWELMVARRAKLTAQQLLSRNTSEAIVDKDNHARDAMKYFLMMQPEPTRKSLERRLGEKVQTFMENAQKQGLSADEAATNLVVRYTQMTHEAVEEDNPDTYYGGNARRRLKMIERQRRGGRRR